MIVEMMKKIVFITVLIFLQHDGMQKSKIPLMVFEHQIIHLDLPGKYGWPEACSSSLKNQKKKNACDD